ncbi:MAG: hypothetical protein J6U54_05310 [Clostridiales bacterium]|nr:hypothetical protein [Clostridiales bacterium]
MGKIVRAVVVGFAMYGACKFLDTHVKRYLQNHRDQVMDKIEYLLFGPDEENGKYGWDRRHPRVDYSKPYGEYAKH